MGFFDKALMAFRYIRNTNGSHFYFKKGGVDFLSGDKLKIATNNPVVSACISIRAQILSKAEFYIEGPNGEMETSSDYIKLINNPNPFQSKQDLLKQFEWYKCAYGWVYQKPTGAVGYAPTYLYNLNSGFIEFPDTMKSSYVIDDKEKEDYFSQKFKYTDGTSNEKGIELKEIIPFFDVTNGLTNHDYAAITGNSKLDSVIKQISNIDLIGQAENKIIGSNGREMYSSASKGANLGTSLPIDSEDKENIESNLINNIGMRSDQNRSIVTNTAIDWTSLHIKHAELGFKESITTNSTLVREIFGIPNELYSAHINGATFENQKEALIGFIQNVIQPVADDLANSWTSHFDLEKTPIKASFSHIPVMQHTEDRKADKLLKIATAFEKLTRAGLDTQTIEELFDNQGIPIKNET